MPTATLAALAGAIPALPRFPGITRIRQVSGRSGIPFGPPVNLELEVECLESRSFWLDAKRPPLTVPPSKGAYRCAP